MTLWTLFSDPTPPHPPGGFGTGLAGDWILPIFDSKNPYFGTRKRNFSLRLPAHLFHARSKWIKCICDHQ